MKVATEIRGISELPKDWVVTTINLTDEVPYALCSPESDLDKVQRFTIPKALAYFLNVHWAGTPQLRELIKRQTQNKIKRALGITE